MSGRRNVLLGDSDSVREERLLQQRDYAAQLQEQVRLKHARAEEAKARRLQEQAAERELMDNERSAVPARRPLQPQPPQHHQQPPPGLQHQPQLSPYNCVQAPPSPVRSPAKLQQQAPSFPEGEMHHATALLGSPSKAQGYSAQWGGTTTTLAAIGYAAPASSSPVALVAPFSPGPSIFDSMLQPDTSLVGCSPRFHEDLQALQGTRTHFEVMWKQRRAAFQRAYTKPSYILTPSPTAASSIPLSADEKRRIDDELDPLSPHADELELSASRSGLIGESVLIPLAKPVVRSFANSEVSRSSSSLSKPSAVSPSSSPSRAISHRRHVRAAPASPSKLELSATQVLRHDSELMHFDATS